MFGLTAGAALALGVGGGVALSSLGGSNTPDESGINAAALSNAQLSKDQLDFAKQIYGDSAPDRAAAAARANAVSDAQLAGMNAATAQANDYADYNKNTFRPLEQGLVSDAENYDTEGNRERLAGLALGDVNQQFGAARAAEGRQMTRMGINPNDGAYAAEATQRGNAQALAGADAENKARQQATTYGHAQKMDAASLGRGLPGNQATQATLALTAGNNSASNAGLPLAQANAAAGLMNQGYAGAVAANNSSGNLYGTAGAIQNTANTQNNAIYGALGTAAGGFLANPALGTIVSDKKAKKNVKRASPEISLAAIKKLPVSNWQYKNGRGDGGSHTGPMAQDVHAQLGSAAAPGGKAIDLVSMNGHTIAAVQALDKKVSKIALAQAKYRG